LKLLVQVLWNVAQVILVTGGIPQRDKTNNFRNNQWKKNGALFTKIGNLLLHYPIVITYLQIQ
jgi:hypothetical protein